MNSGLVQYVSNLSYKHHGTRPLLEHLGSAKRSLESLHPQKTIHLSESIRAQVDAPQNLSGAGRDCFGCLFVAQRGTTVRQIGARRQVSPILGGSGRRVLPSIATEKASSDFARFRPGHPKKLAEFGWMR